jgi:GNAT superfamily N-acetyltransferase
MLGKFQAVLGRGILYSCGVAVNKVVSESVFRFRIFNVYELGLPPGDVPALPAPFTVWRCHDAEAFAIAETTTHYRPGAARAPDGDGAAAAKEALLIMDADRPVGGVWLSRDFFDESELAVRIRLKPDQVWLFAAFVDKSHRRRGIYRGLLNEVLRHPSGTILASINPTNKPSMAAHDAFIRRKIGTCVAIKIGSRAKCWVRGDLRVDGATRPVEVHVD